MLSNAKMGLVAGAISKRGRGIGHLCLTGFVLIFFGLAGCRSESLPGVESIQGPPEQVPASYFAMHVHRLLEGTPWPSVGFTALRLWDTGTKWKDLEPSRGEFHFEKLDRLVGLAEKHHVSLILAFGYTPEWASAIPPKSSLPSQTGPPAEMKDWATFVHTVATRYKGRIAGYEIWNEPNAHNFYNGSVAQMVEMTRVASEQIHRADPAALVLSPSPVSPTGLPWLQEFLARGGGQYVDVLAYHLYVSPGPPEQIPPLALKVRELMTAAHIDKPLWNTETGWGPPRQFSSETEQAGYLMRAMLLGWASGAQRFYWYAWDNQNWATLHMTRGENYIPTQAASAYEALRQWITGWRVSECTRDAAGTWSCRMTAPGQESFIYWNPDHEAPFKPHSASGKDPLWFSPESPLTPAKGEIPPAGPLPRRVLFQTSVHPE